MIDKKIEIDIDGDKKSDIKIDFKTLAIVTGFLISGGNELPKFKIRNRNS